MKIIIDFLSKLVCLCMKWLIKGLIWFLGLPFHLIKLYNLISEKGRKRKKHENFA